jgi:hypothetical protein
MVGQRDEMNLICFIKRYGYATRANPFCKLHGADGKYTNMQNVTYGNNCDREGNVTLII